MFFGRFRGRCLFLQYIYICLIIVFFFNHVQTVIGQSKVTLDGANKVCTFKQCSLGMVVVDSMVYHYRSDNATIALFNGGSISASLPIDNQGKISVFINGNLDTVIMSCHTRSFTRQRVNFYLRKLRSFLRRFRSFLHYEDLDHFTLRGFRSLLHTRI